MTALLTRRLELRALPAAAALALPDDRERTARLLGAYLPPGWPHADLQDVLPLQARAQPTEEQFGIWVMVERKTAEVVGDIGFLGPPTSDGRLEIGYHVIPAKRRCGYATEAGVALVGWALRQPGVRAVVAGCDKGNVASIRTLERIGFSRTGEKDGQLRWQIARGRNG